MRQNIKLLSALSLLISTFLHAQTEDKKTTIYEIDIPPGPCKTVLIELASQTRHEILFGKDANPQVPCPAVNGALSLERALNQTLSTQNFWFSISNGQIRIEDSSKKDALLPKITVVGYLQGIKDISITHEDDSQERFPLANLPLSVQSVSNNQIRDVQARNMDDAVNYIAGVEYQESTGGISPLFYSRGTPTPYSINGKFYSRTLLAFDPAVLERVDIVQGPTANYMFPGGLMNFVTKKPIDKTQIESRVSIASYDYYKTALDVNFGNKISGTRLIGSAENSKGIKGYQSNERYIFSPSYRHTFDNDAQLLLWGMHQEEKMHPNTITLHQSIVNQQLPRDHSTILPWSSSDRSDSFVALTLTDIIWNNWLMTAGANWTQARQDFSIGVFGNTLAPAQILFFLQNSLIEASPELLNPNAQFAFLPYFYSKGNKTRSYGFDVAFEKPVTLLNFEGFIRIGYEYQYFDLFERIRAVPPLITTSETNPIGIPYLALINIDYPNYLIPEPSTPAPIGYSEQPTDFHGIYVTQSYDLSDPLTLYIDLRYEDMKFNDTTINDVDPSVRDLDFYAHYQELTPRVGLNIDWTDSVSSHISYNESFSYQFTLNVDKLVNENKEEFADPIINRQYEVAFKYNWIDDKLLSSLTFYKVESSNILFSNRIQGTFIENAAPNRKFEGVIFNTSGAISDNVEIITNVSYNDNNATTIIGVDDVGNPIPSTTDTSNRTRISAKYVGNLWLYYDSDEGPYKNVNMGFGAKYVGERFGDDANTFTLPSYTVYDVFFDIGLSHNFSLEFSIRNIFDKYYYKSSLGLPFLIEEGEPRTFSLTFKSKHNF